MHLPTIHPDDLGPRPKLKAIRDGIKIYESTVEMTVRLERLRKPGDQRSAERVLADRERTS